MDGLEAQVVPADIRGGRPRIVLFGLFGVGNLGNDATLSVTLHHLRLRLPGARVECACGGLPEDARALGITPLELDPLPPPGSFRIPFRSLRHAYVAIASILTEPLRRRKLVRQLAGAEQLVIVGTGVLDDFGALPWDLPASLLRWCRGAARAGAAVHFLAAGAGPINNSVNRFLMGRAVRIAGQRSYRDKVSKRFLDGMGIDTAADLVVPDLVFGMPREWIAFAAPPASPPRSIGVGLMGYYGWRNVDDEQEGQRIYRGYIAKMSRFVLWLLDQGYEVRLLVGELHTDEVAVRDLLDSLPGEGRRRPVAEPIATLSDVLREVSRTDLVVASRFHNVVCALAMGRPAVSIGYSTKFDALMDEMGLASYCQHIEKLDVDRLISQFQDLAADRAATQAVQRKAAEYRQTLESLFDSTFGAAREGPR